ncbi:MAG: Metal dependent phosphohydrolase [Candidatus Gottesmanbacteria bacterium GW2011_GWB1_43_11]|uniref:Metal dependent phosphohydrolase n=1 Tax=Candidatus Gottesmanbacteria bacterium GW2011_GWB1_43_11 TaxID=1618446 RepID=A0A0G1FL84_9BACT|nr:MAG: Metal dependent phosphohydrolase [Candidatus Gottesmanbacteria bacterium GW2011_GWA2_42_16]KKS56030.1 MAG: Metal dependent phosphohydrolase [Candidatus Gottesmanbacteria bacterium GW2011_GWA1_42_26]KKS81582.1 MAG: Metal dependent phosphohydrolase [Candidatus Gottesmanbacteria bacterium GW2011_GWC1_43_10]KKS87658.1 MAG: Metal dependent phosphohydrolase [Candidatus Gottesmanbacteria bacterium GW2011_GWB1_43_11]OGG25329.1 MAG: hypothetical protein A3A59_04730 [Candidatus Gottesmanbacteria 
MIPTRPQCLALWDKYNLPSAKRIHVEEVTQLAKFFASKLKAQNSNVKINEALVEAAALLHDIDKNVTKRAGERHPDTAERILKELGFDEVAEVVRKHSLHAILDPELTPKTWEEKIVYLADKMTKYEVIGVDHRFKLWYKEHLPPEAVKELNESFPKVKQLEQEIYQAAGITFIDIQEEFQQA